LDRTRRRTRKRGGAAGSGGDGGSLAPFAPDHMYDSANVQRPTDSPHGRLDDVLVGRSPVGLADALQSRPPKLVGNEPGQLAVPRSLLLGLAELRGYGRTQQTDEDRSPEPLALSGPAACHRVASRTRSSRRRQPRSGEPIASTRGRGRILESGLAEERE